MTTMQRHRLARRIGITLAIIGILSHLMTAVTSCSAVASPVAGRSEAGHLTAAVDHTIQTEIPKLSDDRR